MFVAKNIFLIKQGVQVRGKNSEANLSILLFILFIGLSLLLAFFFPSTGTVFILPEGTAILCTLVLLSFNLLVSLGSLLGLKDSWRVGIVKDQKNELQTEGLYKFSRNPYFVSYLILFLSYTVLLQSIILLVLSLIGFFFIHIMILKEEEYLLETHGEKYKEYMKKVPRYVFV